MQQSKQTIAPDSQCLDLGHHYAPNSRVEICSYSASGSSFGLSGAPHKIEDDDLKMITVIWIGQWQCPQLLLVELLESSEDLNFVFFLLVSYCAFMDTGLCSKLHCIESSSSYSDVLRMTQLKTLFFSSNTVSWVGNWNMSFDIFPLWYSSADPSYK